MHLPSILPILRKSGCLAWGPGFPRGKCWGWCREASKGRLGSSCCFLQHHVMIKLHQLIPFTSWAASTTVMTLAKDVKSAAGSWHSVAMSQLRRIACNNWLRKTLESRWIMLDWSVISFWKNCPNPKLLFGVTSLGAYRLNDSPRYSDKGKRPSESFRIHPCN